MYKAKNMTVVGAEQLLMDMQSVRGQRVTSDLTLHRLSKCS